METLACNLRTPGVLVDAAVWDPRLLGGAGVIMLPVAAVAAVIPARRACAVDPRPRSARPIAVKNP